MDTPDRLSNLPDNVLQIIFSGISLREMVRTSLVAPNWRYKWLSFPDLVFTDECIPRSVGSLLRHGKLVETINHVLLVHRKPIRKFKLSSSHLKASPKIDTWVFSLLFDPLEEFELQISQDSYYRQTLPRCMFSYVLLNRLTLVKCVIPDPPSSFKGFLVLSSLLLQSVTVSDVALKCLLASCPELERLTLEHNDGHTDIELSNPKLNYVSISADAFIRICQEMKLLAYARFAAKPHPDLDQDSNFRSFFGSFLGFQELCLESSFLQPPLDGSKPIPFTYHHLKSFSFHLDEIYGTGILFALSLLNCTPNLQKLKIVFTSLWEASTHLQETKNRLENTRFKTLGVINFDGFCGLKIQLLLIKLLLANSPVLETMAINSSTMDGDKELALLKELLQYERTSPRARVMYY